MTHQVDFVEATSPAVLVRTAGEFSRMALAGDLTAFAEQNCPAGLVEADFLADAASVDFDAPKASLLRHPGISKTVRIVASVAAISQAFELRIFERLHFDIYVKECGSEILKSNDPIRKERLESCLRGTKLYFDATPVIRSELLSYAQIHRGNLEYSVKNLINFCRKIVSEWLDFLPAEPMRAMLAEIEGLAAAPLSVQMTFFGLCDFVPSGDLPKEESP